MTHIVFGVHLIALTLRAFTLDVSHHVRDRTRCSLTCPSRPKDCQSDIMLITTESGAVVMNLGAVVMHFGAVAMLLLFNEFNYDPLGAGL